MTDYRWVRDTDGLEYAVVASAVDPEIHDVTDDRVVLDANGVPTRYVEPETLPSKSDNKQAWVDHAVASGMDPEQAKAATKADLIATYGKEN